MHGRRLLCGRQHGEQQSNDAAAHGIAQAIQADVDDRLGGALLRGRDRRVEELVARAEQRAAEYRFAAAGDHRALEAGRDQAAMPVSSRAIEGVPVVTARPSFSSAMRLPDVCTTKVIRLIAA